MCVHDIHYITLEKVGLSTEFQQQSEDVSGPRPHLWKLCPWFHTCSVFLDGFQSHHYRAAMSCKSVTHLPSGCLSLEASRSKNKQEQEL